MTHPKKRGVWPALTILLIAAVLFGLCGACRAKAPRTTCQIDDATAGEHACKLVDHEKRGYDAYVPAGYRAASPPPLLLVLHGGGGNKANALTMTCPDGDADDPGCITALADREGFIVVAPNGTGKLPLQNVRTWNAGGGVDDWQCASGDACRDGVDDIAFFRDLLDDIARWLPYDASRVYVTGLSNGGAMTYRLACEMSDRVAAIAPVGSGDQHGMAQGCEPAQPVAVLHIHGTEDPCWSIDGGTEACLQDDGGRKASAAESIDRWKAHNGCAPDANLDVLDPADDGMTTTRHRYDCTSGAEVTLLEITGGGHTWPSGNQYVTEDFVGPVTQDVDNELIWSFLSAHRR